MATAAHASSELLYEVKDGIGLATFNRPHATMPCFLMARCPAFTARSLAEMTDLRPWGLWSARSK